MPVDTSQLLQQVAKLMQGIGGPLAGAAGSTQSGTAARTPGPMASPAVPAPQGSITAQGLQGIQGGPSPSMGAQPVVPRAAQSSPAYATGFQFATPKARNAAVVTNMMESLGRFGEDLEKHKYQKQVEEARGVVATMLRMGVAADNANDPDAKKLLQEKANEMLGQKEAAKILKDINKPGSAAYFGAQEAYKDVMAENTAKYTQQELQAKIEAEYQRAIAEQERAKAEEATRHTQEVKAEQSGQVTPALTAQINAQEASAAAQILQRDAASQRTLEGTKAMADAMIKSANIRVSALKNATVDKTSKDLQDSFIKQYDSLIKRSTDLDKEATKLQKQISDNPVLGRATGENETIKNRLAGIQMEQQSLQQQAALIQQNLSKVQDAGMLKLNIAATAANAPAAAPPAAPAAPAEAPIAPITVTQEDMDK